MARRNRKKRRRQDGFVFPAPFAGLVVLISSLALVYVWLGCRCEALGRELRALEDKQSEIRKQYANEAFKWARKKSPQSIERALRRCGVAMVWPDGSRVVRLRSEDLRMAASGSSRRDDQRHAKLDRAVRHE